MDTNRNDGQNYQINAFNKGMNTDTALDAVGEGQYIFGQNIRIANNTLLVGNIDPNSKEGLVTPVEEGKTISDINFGQITGILATASIGNVGVVIVRYTYTIPDSDPEKTEQRWKVYRVDKTGDTLSANLLYDSKSATDKDKFSVVINKEQEDIIKLYIADGKHGIMQLFVKNGKEGQSFDYSTLNQAKTEDDLVSGKYFPSDKAIINGTISGKLKTQQVQYTYRFYKRYGIFSKIAPLTNKIHIINSSRDTEQGNAENTTTAIGMSLSVIINEDIRKIFDHVQLIRISYIVAGQPPEINVIKDLAIPTSVDKFQIADTGEDSLEELSLDDLSVLNTQSIVPQVIEQNQGYMFAANINDNTVFTVDSDIEMDLQLAITDVVIEKESEIDNKEQWIFSCPLIRQSSGITHQIPQNPHLRVIMIGDEDEDEEIEEESDTIANIEEDINFNIVTIEDIYDALRDIKSTINGVSQEDKDAITAKASVQSYLKSCSIDVNNVKGYDDMFTSSMCRSLKRGEIYLYGLVLYKKDGTHTDVICQKQITIPTEALFPSWYYDTTDDTLHALPIGIYAKIKIPIQYDDIVGYEIVRCEKTPTTSKTLLTSVLSSPVSEPLGDSKYTPAYPQYFLNTSNTEFRTPVSSNEIYEINPDVDILRAHDYLSMVEPLSKLDSETQQHFVAELLAADQQYQFDSFAEFIFDVKENHKTEPGVNSILQELRDVVTDAYKNEYYSEQMSGLRVAQTAHTSNLVQVFAPEVLFKRQDLLNILSNGVLNMSQVHYVTTHETRSDAISTENNPLVLSQSRIETSEYANKPVTGVVLDYTKLCTLENNPVSLSIKRIKDVKNPLWDSGFAQIDTKSSDSRIINGVKQYKTYNTSIGQYEYVNWVCNGLYDLPISAEEARNSQQFSNISDEDVRVGFRVYNDAVHYDFKTNYDPQHSTASYKKNNSVHHPIGPGPVCLLAEFGDNGNALSYVEEPLSGFFMPTAAVVNIINNSFDGYTEDQKLYTPYYGFGNYHKLTGETETEGSGENQVEYRIGDAVIFDGEAFITMCEFVTMFKAYDFKSLNDTIISNQYVCRVPLESTINTYFDYGMNYRNTQNKNLQLEPGSITNVTTQDRPLHQYNQIYSDNNTSLSVYTAQPLEQRTNKFQQRICYSQHKDNGEKIESWNIFKPFDYIDADTRYGQITNLLSANDMIYFWQDRAFGKLSVNERSLVTDNNNNTIQLGQGGVLQRTDYLSTKYGMRLQDYSAINTESGLFWIDILNRAIVANSKEGVVNYGEMLNVQNLINNMMTDNGHPEIDYDLQNSELLCKCMLRKEPVANTNPIQYNDRIDQLVFNTKYNIATSIYTRQYDKILYFNNILYAINGSQNVKQLNYLPKQQTQNEYGLLLPMILQFAVNSNPSQTKVFDNQKIVLARKDWHADANHENQYGQTITFETELNNSSMSLVETRQYSALPIISNTETITDREGNVCYTIPRQTGVADSNYKIIPQLRMRGKWMTVKITDNNPKQDFAISHIITKFRQSYS